MAKDTNPVPTPEEKEAMQAPLLEKVGRLNQAIDLLIEAKNAVNTQFAEVGNSDKMNYTDRETGEVKKWGISASTMAREEAKAKDAIERALVLLQL